MPCFRMRVILFALLAFALAASRGRLRADAVDYLKEIKPLLRERCYSCHGALKQKKDLRVDTVAGMLKGGTDGPVIVPGDATGSEIIKRITSTDVEERMPPEHEGQPLTAAQVSLLRDWIVAGAPAPSNEQGERDPTAHWAFRECVRPPVPAAASRAWVRNPIHAFVASVHAHP